MSALVASAAFALPARAGVETTFDGVAYFLKSDPARIERYVFDSASFISPIPLDGSPSALWVGDHGVFVAYGPDVVRMNLDGSEPRILVTVGENIADLVGTEQLLFIAGVPTVWAIDARTGDILSSERYIRYLFRGVSVAPLRGAIFGRSQGSPSDLVAIAFDASGVLGDMRDTPYHGDLPVARRTWLYPNEELIVDDGGTVYSVNDLEYAGSLGDRVDAVSFYGALPVAARGRRLSIYDEHFAEIGRFTATRNIESLFVTGNLIHIFSAGGQVEIVERAQLVPPEIGASPGVEGSVYAPDEIVLGNDDVVYVLSAENKLIFRWLGAERRYGDSIVLTDPPTRLGFSHAIDRLYVAYDSGRLTEIRPTPPFEERPLSSIVPKAFALVPCADFLFAATTELYWIFNTEGALTEFSPERLVAAGFACSPSKRRLYRTELQWDAISVDGRLEGSRRQFSSRSFAPLRLSPEGDAVVDGSGRVSDGETLEEIVNLGFLVGDAAWHDGNLYTLRRNVTPTLLERWDDAYQSAGIASIEGSPVRVLSLDAGLLVITDVGGRPTFTFTQTEVDSDQDGIIDADDNCPSEHNPDQEDTDRDGAGDVCDPFPSDSDDDGVPAEIDNCPDVFNPLQEDADHDSLGDVCDRYPNAFDHLMACFEEVDRHDEVVMSLTAQISGLEAERDALQRELDELRAAQACEGDLDGDGNVTVDEIVRSVNNALNGCGP